MSEQVSSRQDNQPALSIKRGSDTAWRTDAPNYAQLTDASKEDYLAKYGNACACCGWESKSNLIVQDEENPSKLIMLCSLCVLPTAIGYALTNGKGKLFILPELTQTEINNLFRWAFLGVYAEKMLDNPHSWLHQANQEVFLAKAKAMAKLAPAAHSLNAMIKDRGEERLRSFFNTKVATEMFFPVALSQVTEAFYSERNQRLAPLRFIPNYSALSEQEWHELFIEVDFSFQSFKEAYPDTEF